MKLFILTTFYKYGIFHFFTISGKHRTFQFSSVQYTHVLILLKKWYYDFMPVVIYLLTVSSLLVPNEANNINNVYMFLNNTTVLKGCKNSSEDSFD